LSKKVSKFTFIHCSASQFFKLYSWLGHILQSLLSEKCEANWQ